MSNLFWLTEAQKARLEAPRCLEVFDYNLEVFDYNKVRSQKSAECRMNFLRRHWYNSGLVFGAIAIAVALLGNLQTVQIILLLFYAALTLHQFEELGWPGGFPWYYNEIIRPKGGPFDRNPLNQNNNLFINVWAAYPITLLPVFFPDSIWMGFGIVLFGFGQVIVHAIAFNIKLKYFYNPGMATVLLLYLPLNVWYLVEVYSHQTVPLWNWAAGFGYFAFFSAVLIMWVGFTLLTDKNSPYPFAPEELERWNPRGHRARLGLPENSAKG